MAWIDLVANRYKAKIIAKKIISSINPSKEDDLYHLGHLGIISVFQAKEKELIAKYSNLFDPYYNYIQKIYRNTYNYEFLCHILPVSILKHIRGEDQSNFWEKIINYKTKDEELIALQHITRRMFDNQPVKLKKNYKGIPYTRKSIIKLLNTNPEKTALDIATAIEHPGYRVLMIDWIFPLAYIISNYVDTSLDFYELVANGPNYKSHQNVLYERSQPKPKYLRVKFDSKIPETWPDFDAIELVDDELKIYHQLEYQYPDLTIAFGSLNSDIKSPLVAWKYKDECLKLVKENTSESNYNLIVNKINENKVEHIIVYNKKDIVNLLDEAIENYSNHYGINLICKEMLKI